jgi:phage FluMu gp28-like protein
MATFMEDAAAVFRGVRDIIDDTLRDADPDGSYVMGVDLAKSSDYTVLTVMDMRTNSVVYWERFNEIDWNLQKARIEAVARRYNDARVIIDSTGVGDPIVEDLKRAGLMIDDVKLNNLSKDKLITKAVIFVEQRLCRIPDIDELVNELDAYAFTRSDGGVFKYSAPSGLHDDAVISFALAIWALDRDFMRPNPLFVQRVMRNRGSSKSFR